MMVGDVGLLRRFEAAPLRTLRLRDLGAEGNPWRAVDRLVDIGALHRLTHGIYIAPPDGRDGRTWRPPAEAAALAIGVARFGARGAALMGVSAARHWGAIPRAIGEATIAVARHGYAPLTLDDGTGVRFVKRDLEDVELVKVRTALGEGLTTTVAQTLLDLARTGYRDDDRETDAALRNLTAQVDPDELRRIAAGTTRPGPGVRALMGMIGARG